MEPEAETSWQTAHHDDDDDDDEGHPTATPVLVNRALSTPASIADRQDEAEWGRETTKTPRPRPSVRKTARGRLHARCYDY